MDIPAGWNKRLKDLRATDHGDGELSITGEEFEYAREYERRLLRPWARFPHEGDVYEALDDVKVDFLTHWKAPFTGDGSGILPKGTRVRVSVHGSEPVGVYAQPINRPDLEAQLVPVEQRTASNYGGFSLSIHVEQLNKLYRLVEDHDSAT